MSETTAERDRREAKETIAILREEIERLTRELEEARTRASQITTDWIPANNQLTARLSEVEKERDALKGLAQHSDKCRFVIALMNPRARVAPECTCGLDVIRKGETCACRESYGGAVTYSENLSHPDKRTFTRKQIHRSWSCEDAAAPCAHDQSALESATKRAEVATDELRDLCNSIVRIGWDRTAADVHEQAVQIIAKLDGALTSAPTEGENKNG